MPTTRPRYTFTDAGHVRDLLDRAQRQWPEIDDRKQLLLRLAETGHELLGQVDAAADAAREQERRRAALANLRRIVDWDAIADDQAWR